MKGSTCKPFIFLVFYIKSLLHWHVFFKTCKERFDTRGDATALLRFFSGYGIDGRNTKACVKLFYVTAADWKEEAIDVTLLLHSAALVLQVAIKTHRINYYFIQSGLCCKEDNSGKRSAEIKKLQSVFFFFLNFFKK